MISRPLTILNVQRSSARTAGPAVRLPSWSNALPWHGQPKPAGTTGSSVISPFAVFSYFVGLPRIWPVGPFACTGQPRWAQRLEMIVKLGSFW